MIYKTSVLFNCKLEKLPVCHFASQEIKMVLIKCFIIFCLDYSNSLHLCKPHDLPDKSTKCLYWIYIAFAHWQLHSSFILGSGCFATDDILPKETILPSPFMCVYIAIMATILAVML